MVKTKIYIFYWLDDNETIFNTSLPRFYYVYTFMGTAVKTLSRGKKVSRLILREMRNIRK